MSNQKQRSTASFATNIHSEEITFYGHSSMTALHRTTVEITKEKQLTTQGDCIIGVSASKSVNDIAPEMKSLIRLDGTTVKIAFNVGGQVFEIRAEGDSKLALSDERDMVIRKSSYISERTLAVRANKSAMDFPRSMVRSLRDPSCMGTMILTVERK